MRSGNKPRRRAAAETVQASSSLEPVSADNQSGMQLPLGPLEEPAEILVRFSTDEPEAAAGPVAEPSAESGAAEPSEAATADFAAEPAAYQPAESGPVEDASLLMRLARIHLRTGSLTTACAQLEALAGRNLLDTAGTLDLAEARWRTGDLRGAGEAAGAYLAANGGEALGLVIAAEAASLDNHDVEARRHMEQALLQTLTSLDAIFAGVPHRLTLTQSGPETTAAPEKTPAAESPKAVAAAEPVAKAAAETEAIETAAEAETAAASAELAPEVAGTPATEASTAGAPTQRVVDSGGGQADTEIAAGIAVLETGDALLAALHFGIALRMTPESAQAVLGAIGDRHDLALELVRGDALRMQGHERDAGQAYQSVASALSGARTAAETPAETTAEAAAETPVEPPAETTAEAAAETPVEPPAETTAEAAAETPVEPPAETTAEAAAETPVEPPAETTAEAAAEMPVEPPAETPVEPPGPLPVDAAAEVPAEQAATNPTHAPQGVGNPEPRLPEPVPPISWLD